SGAVGSASTSTDRPLSVIAIFIGLFCPDRHGRACPGQPRFDRGKSNRTRMPGTSLHSGRPEATPGWLGATAYAGNDYCWTLIPLASMNFDQLVISRSSLALNAGPGANDGSVSTLVSRARTAGLAMASCSAFSSLARIGSGVPLGTNKPHQNSRSTSANLYPSSLRPGTFGNVAARLGLVTNMAFTSLPSTCALATGNEDVTTATKPPATACAAGPPTLNGT